jgi:hypothetical protein
MADNNTCCKGVQEKEGDSDFPGCSFKFMVFTGDGRNPHFTNTKIQILVTGTSKTGMPHRNMSKNELKSFPEGINGIQV